MLKTPHFVVILCGGTGPRLWPMSRASYPKPFLNIFGKNTLLQQTYTRAKAVVPSTSIYVVTNKKYNSIVKQQIPGSNVILEPSKKNTARAIIFAIQQIQKKHPQAIITTLPSDHFIKDVSQFKKDLSQCYNQALSGQISLLGITPDGADISYGYLSTDGHEKVNQFIEKPDLNTARHLTYQPNTFWNSGIYTFSIPTMISEFEKYQPHYLNHNYSESLELSIDVAISQNSKILSFIPASFDWSDVGEWKTIYDLLPQDEKHLATLNSTKFIEYNSSNCLVSSTNHKLVGLVGIKDLAIIDTPDGLLICNLKDDNSYDVRNLVAQIVKNKNTEKYFLERHDQR